MSLTPDYSRKVGLGVAPSPTPFLTPRPDRRRPDSSYSSFSSRSTTDYWNPSRHDNNRESNVQVLLRCRPLSDEEQRLNIPKAVTCNEHKREVTLSHNVANKQVDKVFTFDKVFGPKAQQRSIYDQAISPVVNDVLEGFNCTVFAYGQTGTGKTYTMEGGMKNKSGELPAEAGVIPRAVRQIFDTLEAQNADYSMKVTFLELYNEEITDLLAPTTEEWSRPPLPLEERQKKPVSLMEDGKGCVILRGLEEEAVYSANEIYNLLERGAAKRRTADTLLNKRSSRSHSVFTITVHIKEATVGDEELIKCGKLNLVDLAGSENISRSGAREGRAREAGEINKSLLTLGRVINALVEHSVHVPYRDSKLTRLLRDSLGGKTKTCIIATISSSAQCLEETLSTLDYAHRAKNIKNKPEANQKISKAVLLKDLYLEIERMKQDVRAAREKNGVYVPHERFVLDEAEKKAKNEKIEQLEIDLNISKKEVSKFRELFVAEQVEKLNFERELSDCQINLGNCHKTLQDLEEKHRLAISTLKEKEFIISKLLHSETCLVERAKELRTNLHNASEDISSLFSEIDRKNRLETQNQKVLMAFGSQLDQSLKEMHKTILGSVSQQHEQLRCMEEHASLFLARKCDLTEVLESRIKKLNETYTLGVTTLKDLADTLQAKACSDMEQMKSKVSSQVAAAENFLATAISEGRGVVCNIQESLNEQKQMLIFSSQQEEEGLQRALVSAQVISKATVDFFNDLSQHASKLITVVGESQVNKTNQLATFEKMFKEEAAREEKVAMEKIARILATLTANRTAMVSEASRNIEETYLQESKLLRQEMSKVHQVSAVAKQGLNSYIDEVKNHFVEDTFTSAQLKAAMENCLQECTSTVDCSMIQWDNAQLSINRLHKNITADTESMLKAKLCENHSAQKEFVSACSSVDADFEVKACDVHSAVIDSLKLDRETKKELDSISGSCLDQLKSIRENHSGSILNIRNQAEHCLRKDYVVDDHQHSVITRRDKVIEVPSLVSIEEMRTQTFEDLVYENKQKWFVNNNSNEGKTIQQQQQELFGGASPNRTPFANIN